MNIDPPLQGDDPSVLADWLELIAVLSEDRRAHFDELSNAAEISEDTENEDIAADDAKHEAMIESVTEELRRRRQVLSEYAYPYGVSDNGEVLSCEQELTYGQMTYVVSLVICHSWASGKLVEPTKLCTAELHSGRDVFEVLTAVAAVGIACGPSCLLGTNRIGADGLKDRIQEICRTVGEGNARDPIHEAAPQSANDDKVDVLAVELENDGPPHRSFWFCQSAAGANYASKPIINEIKRFVDIWFDDPPANTAGAVFFPAVIDEKTAHYETRRLGQLFHRLRMPKQAQSGFEQISENGELLKFVDDIGAPGAWLEAYFNRVKEAAT